MNSALINFLNYVFNKEIDKSLETTILSLWKLVKNEDLQLFENSFLINDTEFLIKTSIEYINNYPFELEDDKENGKHQAFIELLCFIVAIANKKNEESYSVLYKLLKNVYVDISIENMLMKNFCNLINQMSMEE